MCSCCRPVWQTMEHNDVYNNIINRDVCIALIIDLLLLIAILHVGAMAYV